MELLDFTQKRETAEKATKFDRLTEQNKMRIRVYAAAILSDYDFQTLYNALSLHDRKTIDGYMNSFMAEQTQPKRM